MSTLARTPLHDWHSANNGRMVDFAGWSMPVQYGSIVAEHHATRRAAGLFDISHMGRIDIHGEGAQDLLECLLTRRVSDMRPGQIRYSLMCNAEGGVLDDVLAYRASEEGAPGGGSPLFQGPMHLVVNAGNRAKLIDWITDRQVEFAARIEDLTTQTAMIAVQGPKAIGIVQAMADRPIDGLKNYTGMAAKVDGVDCYASRTGYTGEDGVELICASPEAPALWEKLHAAVVAAGGSAVGLAARDTLRLEAAMPLFGHELSEEITPSQAGLGFAVNLKGREFIGSEAIAQSGEEAHPTRVGLVLDGKRSPRQGYPVMAGDAQVGVVTSGGYSPTLDRPIAMAYVGPTMHAVGTGLEVDLRGQRLHATVVELPFYRRPSSSK
ncbi:Glycine cleavage system T protein [Pirellulimonas nuda]|uniref:Aminomethyltransferase n=1 Tax=Pirellulimonas nuda TaxID=2528009 RepID=A0A518D7N6_9BACT|nr:glycine cleavage system aminomethyltransferase GcvT [Pirellulimonas nuda]QDU87493.1 Glycine cleavage system T protein [Pirellulimonas nuda]